MATDSLRLFNKKLAEKLIEQGADENEVFEVCFSEDEIYLDYYGCFAYLNGYDWENTISSLKLFPDNEDGETFILLKPGHVDKIINSLRQNVEKLTIMTEKEIDKILEFKNFCTENDGFMVAYIFDF